MLGLRTNEPTQRAVHVRREGSNAEGRGPHVVEVHPLCNARVPDVSGPGVGEHVPEGALLVGPAVLVVGLVGLVPLPDLVVLKVLGIVAYLPDLAEEIERLRLPPEDNHPRVRVHEIVARALVGVEDHEGVVAHPPWQNLVPPLLLSALAVCRLQQLLNGLVKLLDDHLRIYPHQGVDLAQELLHEDNLVPVLSSRGELRKLLIDVERVSVPLRVLKHDGCRLGCEVLVLVVLRPAAGDDANLGVGREVDPVAERCAGFGGRTASQSPCRGQPNSEKAHGKGGSYCAGHRIRW
mmetsp:Transcript_60796/g.181141  ORF Transcript_60796/g.181141 Transcript_60796/m.181141 type:complete len:293 (+) Transcript_60796:99-977(+)